MSEFRKTLKEIIGDATEEYETLRFPFYPTKETMEADIETLQLSVRAKHCLMRNELCTVGAIIDKFNKVKVLRSCGAKTAAEIRKAVCEYLYDSMQNTGRKQFWKEFIELNGIKGLSAM